MTTAPYKPLINIAYRPEVSFQGSAPGNFSKTPTKPARFVNHLAQSALQPFVKLQGGFKPFGPDDFKVAHTARYVDDFFAGRGLAHTNGMEWSPEFVASVCYANASLSYAVERALQHPEDIILSPTGGFHHATPEQGGGFCTFSGQVIAALRAFATRGAVGAWIDLDGHFGNSIEDSRRVHPLLNQALPVNINPEGRGRAYLADLRQKLNALEERVLTEQVDYICFAHGADSHHDDDLGGQLSTEEWLSASDMVYGRLRVWSNALGRPVPTVLALFGGYREDDPASVLELHAADLQRALTVLADVDLPYPTPRVVAKTRRVR